MSPPAEPGGPLDDTAFARLMAAVGPFESQPALAVGVSGGSDSMALVLLAARWAAARGGTVQALTVDHGLRQDSAAEAADVGRRLARHGIPHVVLRWEGPRPASGVQAAARAARRGLLGDWCRGAGVPHLLLAHTEDDQAETVLMRRLRARAGPGLAGMAVVAHNRDVRVVRPLLGVMRECLRATLRTVDESWTDDPSNDDPRFERVRARAKLAGTAGRCDARARLLALARRAGTARRVDGMAVDALLGDAAAIDPAGFARLDAAAWGGNEPVLRAALAAVLTTVAGAAYAPADAAVARAALAMAQGRAATLGGCRIVPKGGHWLVVREARAAREARALAEAPFLWDGRFAVTTGGAAAPGLTVRRLGRDGWDRIARRVRAHGDVTVPFEALAALPAVWNLDGPVAVPHLKFRQSDEALPATLDIRFRPRHTLGGTPFVPAPGAPAASLAAPGPHAKMFARDRAYDAVFGRLSATETTV